jgi:hypothetical protein
MSSLQGSATFSVTDNGEAATNLTELGYRNLGPYHENLKSCLHDKDLQHFLLPIMVRLPQILQSLGTRISDHIMKISWAVAALRTKSGIATKLFCGGTEGLCVSIIWQPNLA